MKHRKILKYIFSLLILIHFQVGAQDTSAFDGIRLSVDLGSLPGLYIFPDQQRFELQTDFKFKPDFYGVGEAGLFKTSRERDNFNYFQSGTFYRVGLGYNAIESKQDDILTIGGRIGSSFFSQYAENISITATDSMWNDVSVARIQEQSHSAFWIELVLSMKVELVHNLYIGWTVRGRAMLFGAKAQHLEPYYVPGFGRGNKKTAVGFNYYICYKIPLNF